MVKRVKRSRWGRTLGRSIERGMWRSRIGASQVQSAAEAKRLRRCARNIMTSPGHIATEWERPGATMEVLYAAASLRGDIDGKVKITQSVQLAIDPSDPDWKRRR